jgi:hypothetical protein
MKMQTIRANRTGKKISLMLISFLLMAFLFQTPAKTYLHNASQNLVQWGMEKAVSAAVKELRKRARFE